MTRHSKAKPDKHQRLKATLESIAARIAPHVDYIREVKRLVEDEERLKKIGEAIRRIESVKLDDSQEHDLGRVRVLYNTVCRMEDVLELFVFEDGNLHIPEVEKISFLRTRDETAQIIMEKFKEFRAAFLELREAIKPLAEAYNEIRRR